MIMDVDTVLTRWRVALPDKLAARYEGFMSRHGVAVRALVAAWLTNRNAREGEDPEEEAEFAAYDAILPAERARDAQPDRAVVEQVLAEVDAQLRDGFSSRLVLSNFGLEYVDSRIEAIVIRRQGWDAVPLMLERPALVVVVQERVVAFRSAMGTVKFRPDVRGTLNGLHSEFRKAEEAVLALRETVNSEWDSPARLQEYALKMWTAARGGAAPEIATPAGGSPATDRPRAGEKAYRWLTNKLEADLRQGVSIGGLMYHSPSVERRQDALVIEFRAQGGRWLVLWAAPLAGYAGRPNDGPVDVRGEMHERDGEAVVATFPWTVVERKDLVELSDATVARWFDRPVSPPPKLTPVMLTALAALKEEEDNAPGAMHMWADVPRSVQDALIRRGYVNALTNDKGGFPHYVLTAAGRNAAPLARPKWIVAHRRVKRLDADEFATGAGSTGGYVVRVSPDHESVIVEQDDGQVVAWPIGQVSLELERPISRGPWLVFWDLPWLAIKGVIPVGRTGEAVSRQMELHGFSWDKRLGRYQRPADDADGWRTAQEIVVTLTPGEEWSTPTDKVLRHISRLPEGASGWSGPGGPKWEGANGKVA